MKIEITNKPNDNFYKEFLSVLFSINKIKKNYNYKLEEVNKFCFRSIIIQVILSIIMTLLIDYISYSFYGICITLLIFIILLNVFVLFDYNKKVKEFLKNADSSTIVIDESGVELIEKLKTCKINYEMIELVLINKYSICVIPRDMTGIMIGVPIEYKDRFLESIRSYNESILIIDNYK